LTPYLTDAEIADICEPLVMPAAQRRFLASLGLVVKAKPNGRALVARAELERVLVGRRPDQPAPGAQTGPNVLGLDQWAKQRKVSGQKSQGR